MWALARRKQKEMTMRRIITMIAACALASLALVANAQAATRSANGRAVKGHAKVDGAKKGAKATPFALYAFDEVGELVSEGKLYLVKKTHTWYVEPFCDEGSYSKVGKTYYLDDSCTGEVWNLSAVKKDKGVYFGPATYEGAFDGYYDEIIQE